MTAAVLELFQCDLVVFIKLLSRMGSSPSLQETDTLMSSLEIHCGFGSCALDSWPLFVRTFPPPAQPSTVSADSVSWGAVLFLGM